MKKVLFIMVAALMTMTQCRKQETMPVTPSANTIKMTVTAGSGAKTDINTETGAITWSAGDKLYVSDGTNWLGSLTLVGEGGSAQGTFTGSIAGIGEGETPCHFFYLGHDNGMTEPTGTAAASISFAAQDGTLAGAMKYHTGYGSTDVTVESGVCEGYVLMNTKIAIAHINFTKDSQPYTGSVTMGGTGISNTLSVSPDGTFSGGGDGGITIGNGNGTTGERFVTLIPTGTTDVLNVAFTGDATGSMAFAKGIHENKFYGMSEAIAVALEAPAPTVPTFTVDDEGTTVEFAPGNLWADATGETPVFYFEANQWGIEGSWKTDHVSLFKWGDEANAVTDGFTASGTLFCASNFTVTGDSHTGWRTLSKAEWEYLLNTRCNNGGSSLRAWKELDDGAHKGLVILPDDTDASVMESISSTADLASSGAVFLPVSGSREGAWIYNADSKGFYWSSTSIDEGKASYVGFDLGGPFMSDTHKLYGHAVRLVRDAE